MARGAARAALACLCLGPMGALAVEVEPYVSLGETYTSNVNLAPDGLEESEWVTSVVPSIRIGHDGRGMQLELTYALEALFYKEDSDRNEVFNQLNANGLFDLVGDELQLRVRGGMTQVNVAPEAPVSSNNINVTGNRTDANTWDVGPEWRTAVLGSSEFTGFARVGGVTYNDNFRSDEQATAVPDVAEDISTLEARAALRSVEDLAGRITYELAYEFERLDYDISGEAEQQAAYLRAGYRLSPALEAFGTARLDSDFEDFSDSSLSEFGWEAGFAAQSAHTRLEAAAGRRYFGSTWRASLEHWTDSSRYSLNYNESPTTTDRTQIRQIPVDIPGEGDPVPPPPPDTGIDRFGNPTRFLEKRATGNATWTLYRTTVELTAFWERRENQAQLDPTTDVTTTRDDESSYGGSARVAWQLGEQTELGASAGWRQRDFINESDPDNPLSDEDSITNFLLYLDHQLGLRTTVSFRTGLQQREGSANADGDYDEYWASVQLGRSF